MSRKRQTVPIPTGSKSKPGRCGRGLPHRTFATGPAEVFFMAAEKLKCKECGTDYPLEALYVCERCFGPLEVVYDHSRLDDLAALRRRIQAGSQDVWRYADFLPLSGPPPGPGNRQIPLPGVPAGWTPLVRAERLGERLGLRNVWVKNDAANPTHSF